MKHNLLKKLRATQCKNEVIELRGYQQEIIDEWLETDLDLALSASRRIGKSILVLRYVDKYLSSNPNSSCIYFANTLEQAADIVFKNTTEDGAPYIGAIINSDNLVPSRNGYIHGGKVLKYKNGSTFKIAGVINSTVSKQGGNANLIVYDEAGLMGNKFKELYDLMSPSVSLTGGRQIVVSTVRFGSDFNKLFIEKNEGFHRVVLKADEVYDDNGERVLTDEFLEKQRKKQSKERFLQEWFCDMEVANEASIYAQSFDKAKYVDFILKRGAKIYCSMDLGINDSTVLVFGTFVDGQYVVFDYYKNNNEPSQHYINHIRSKPYDVDTIIMPFDGRNRHDAGEYLVSRESFYREAGFNVEIVKAIRQQRGIEVTRAAIQNHKIAFADNTTTYNLIAETKKYEWKQSKDGIEYVPHHNNASNTADALEYTAIYFFLDEYTDKTDNTFESFRY